MAPKTPSGASIAKHLDLTPPRWTQLREKLAPAGTETLDDIRVSYIRMLRIRARGRPTSQDDGNVTKADHWRVEKLRQEALKLELENKRKRAEALDTEDVQGVWNLMLSNFRARVLQLPSKLMPLISAAKAYGEAEQVMKAGVNECLQELSECDPASMVKFLDVEDAEESPE